MSIVTNNESGDEPVIIATLVRNSIYVFNHMVDGESKGYYTFERAVPVPVSEELADVLEELTEEVPDSDGDLITKDLFKIDRDAQSRTLVAPRKNVRFRMVREEITETPTIKAPLRKPPSLLSPAPSQGKKPGVFGRRG